MDSDKKTAPDGEHDEDVVAPDAPADALSRTPDDLEQDEAAQQEAAPTPAAGAKPAEKKVSPIKQFFRKVNLYFLIFLLILIIVGVIAVVTYLNDTKPAVEPNIANQELTEDTLKELANNDATIGDTSQTLTIQGNAIIAGETLMRGNLNVAGNIQSGGSIRGSSLTISGTSNLSEVQINSLQVASNTAVQGNTTLRDLSVSGSSTFNGPITASRLTVTDLILSGNASLSVPNHISFTGPTPSRSINSGVLGSGGSASIDGSDTAGTVKISTGGGTSAGCFVRVTFQQSFTNQPHVIISPVGTAAGQTQYYVDRDRSGFNICTAAPAPANRSFAFDYFVTN